jgi:hypothetical protein
MRDSGRIELVALKHGGSLRTVIVTDEGDSVWLYLTHPDELRIAADCWLLNRAAALPGDVLRSRFEEYRRQALPPPAPAEAVGPDSLRTGKLEASDVAVTWSHGGEAVAVWVDGQAVGFIGPGERRGHSRHLRAPGPWGEHWDETAFRRLLLSADG